MEYIKLNRDIIFHEIFSDNLTFKLFATLLFLSDKNGQIKTSATELTKFSGLTAAQLRTRLKELESFGEINRETTNHCSVIQICKYKDYAVD